MSSCSSSYCDSSRRCRCGLVARHYTAFTTGNAGRRFVKCPKLKNEGCGFWEWEDDQLPSRVADLILGLKKNLDGVKEERDTLKKKVAYLEGISSNGPIDDDGTVRKLKEKLVFQKIIMFMMLGCIVGLIISMVMK